MMLKQKGAIALISLLIITAVALAIGLSLNLLGIDEMRMGFRESKSSETYHVAESCLEEALMRFKRDANYSGGTLQIGNGSCNINIVVNGSQRTITVTGTVDQLIRKIQTVINVLNDGTTFGNETVDWQEIP